MARQRYFVVAVTGTCAPLEICVPLADDSLVSALLEAVSTRAAHLAELGAQTFVCLALHSASGPVLDPEDYLRDVVDAGEKLFALTQNALAAPAPVPAAVPAPTAVPAPSRELRSSMASAAVTGLAELLGSAKSLFKLEVAAAWCTEHGADNVADLAGYEDEFAAALALPRIKHEKLLKALKVLISGESGERPAELAPPPAPAPAASPVNEYPNYPTRMVESPGARRMQDQQSEEVEAVTSRFREAVQVAPTPDEVDALPLAVTMVALPNELLQYIFQQVCNALDPRIAVPLSSVCNALRTATWALLKQLKEDHEAAAALCLKLGHGEAGLSCKILREAKDIYGGPSRPNNLPGLTPADLGLLGTLGSVLPALELLHLCEPEFGDGVQQLVAGLGAGALPALRRLQLARMHVGDAGAMALAAALEQGAMPRLSDLFLICAAIGDEGLVALAPALRRRPALESLDLNNNPFGDEGLTALVAPPPPPADVPPPTTGVLTELKLLSLGRTQITDAGCATLAAALDTGALPALEDAAPFHESYFWEDDSSSDGYASADDMPVSDEAVAAVLEAMARRRRVAQTQLGLP